MPLADVPGCHELLIASETRVHREDCMSWIKFHKVPETRVSKVRNKMTMRQFDTARKRRSYNQDCQQQSRRMLGAQYPFKTSVMTSYRAGDIQETFLEGGSFWLQNLSNENYDNAG